MRVRQKSPRPIARPLCWYRDNMKATNLDAASLRDLAAKIQADPRTIAKALRGEPVRGLAGHRVRAGLKRLGIALLPTADPNPNGQR